MDSWPYPIVSYLPLEVQIYVTDDNWQKFRRSLKRIPTSVKLTKLREYYCGNIGRAYDVRVSNYINALKRGGQLSMDLRVQR